ncbi:MAG TPA: hypothetical protein VMT32_10645 [Bryobacteraceae bacterium]|nr:hypothetical protein [Bryobacteraceae bacterium]
MSSAACDDVWRRTEKWFCGNGFALPANAARCSSCAPVVIEGSDIAVWSAGSKLACGSGDQRIAGTSKAWKAGSITATASGSTASAIAGRA